jgi:hypothetical protein
MGFFPWLLGVEEKKGEREGAGEDGLDEGKKRREWSRPEVKQRGEGSLTLGRGRWLSLSTVAVYGRRKKMEGMRRPKR